MIKTHSLLESSAQRPDNGSNVDAISWVSRLLADAPSTRFSLRPNEQMAEIEPLRGRAKRDAEFAAGRRGTAELLATFGERQRVGVNEDRSPIWPSGYVGSISHSDHWTWAVVAARASIRSIGIDTEPVMSKLTFEQIRDEVATETELRLLGWLGLSAEQTLTLIFSAKEAFYKCRYPLDQHFLDFRDVRVVATTADQLSLVVAEDASFEPLEAYFRVEPNDVFTVTWMEANCE